MTVRIITDSNGRKHITNEPLLHQPAPVQDQSMFDCGVQARPLSHPLRAYHIAMSEGPLHYEWTDKPHRLVYDLIAAVRFYANRAAPVQEPVACGYDETTGNCTNNPCCYTTPPAAQRQWTGLTDEEISEAYNAASQKALYRMGTTREDVYEAIEAKLKEKNT